VSNTAGDIQYKDDLPEKQAGAKKGSLPLKVEEAR